MRAARQRRPNERLRACARVDGRRVARGDGDAPRERARVAYRGRAGTAAAVRIRAVCRITPGARGAGGARSGNGGRARGDVRRRRPLPRSGAAHEGLVDGGSRRASLAAVDVCARRGRVATARGSLGGRLVGTLRRRRRRRVGAPHVDVDALFTDEDRAVQAEALVARRGRARVAGLALTTPTRARRRRRVAGDSAAAAAAASAASARATRPAAADAVGGDLAAARHRRRRH